MPRLLTRAQFARKTKYSRARITQLVNQEVIILKNGKIDPIQAEKAITANIDRSRREKIEKKKGAIKTSQMEFKGNGFNNEHQMGAPGDRFNTEGGNGKGYEGKSLTETRRDLEERKIILHEIKIKELRGELVPKSSAIEWLSLIVNNARSRLWGLPKRMAGPLASITNEKEIEQYLRTEIREILVELGSPLKKKPKSKNESSASYSR